MALVYKGQVLHDGNCMCCEITDADPVPTPFDPTGTGPIRRAFITTMGVKWRKVKAQIRDALVAKDMLGLAGPSVLGTIIMVQTMTTQTTKMQIFQRWLDTLMQNEVVQNAESTVRPHIVKAYAKGVAFGNKQVNANIYPHGSDTESAIVQLAHIELQGVAEAVSQQAVRTLAMGMLQKNRPSKLARDIGVIIDKIGVGRTNDIANVLIVRAFSDATLDVYEAVGIEEVGTIPESIRGAAALDARAKARQKSKARKKVGKSRRTGAGSRTKDPSASTIYRIRKEQEAIERLKRVDIVTAGDDRVCAYCEELEDNGPYNINVARSLIPAHPRCRCAFVPVEPRARKK